MEDGRWKIERSAYRYGIDENFGFVGSMNAGFHNDSGEKKIALGAGWIDEWIDGWMDG